MLGLPAPNANLRVLGLSAAPQCWMFWLSALLWPDVELEACRLFDIHLVQRLTAQLRLPSAPSLGLFVRHAGWAAALRRPNQGSECLKRVERCPW